MRFYIRCPQCGHERELDLGEIQVEEQFGIVGEQLGRSYRSLHCSNCSFEQVENWE